MCLPTSRPVTNALKDLFPSTTAYALSMAVSNPAGFTTDLTNFQNKAGLQTEKDALFAKVKAGTGINLVQEFTQLLGNEFAVVTTRYQEK
jgi:hypothetical protein